MKSSLLSIILAILLISMLGTSDVLAHSCANLLQAATEESVVELSSDAQKVAGYFSHLIRNYFDEHTGKKIMFAKHFPVAPEREDDISDFRFRTNISRSSQITLMHGVRAALNRPGIKQSWPQIQIKLQEAEGQNAKKLYRRETIEQRSIGLNPL